MRKVLFLAAIFWASEAQAQGTSADLLRLNELIPAKPQFVAEKEQRIVMLRKRLAANPGAPDSLRFQLCDGLFREYSSFIYDSAFAYARRLVNLAHQMHSPPLIGYAKTQMGFATLSAGMFKETFDSLNTVRISDLTDSTKLEFYALMARVLYDLSDFNRDTYYAPRYDQMADKYIEFATGMAHPDSYHFLYLKGLHHLRTERSDEALKYLNKLLNHQLSGHRMAIVASTLSFLHLKLGDTTRAVDLLAQACVSDIRSATKETLALTRLAQIMHQQGRLEEAYLYINESMADAEYYGAKQRRSEVGAILPIIASARVHSIDRQRKTLMVYSAGLSVLALLTIGFAISTVLQFRKLRRNDRLIEQANQDLTLANTQLTEANKIKEEYLGYYFNIISEYLEKIEHFKSSVDQKLINRKFEDIRYDLRRIDVKKERERLYYSFDKVFLKLFPDFVGYFNSFFKEEDQVVLEKDQLLNTELRIFALIRMGITDADRLAMILGYSVNTIYAYKNRVKSKSILPNEEFERKIMEIQAI